jgi:hypothetical protein
MECEEEEEYICEEEAWKWSEEWARKIVEVKAAKRAKEEVELKKCEAAERADVERKACKEVEKREAECKACEAAKEEEMNWRIVEAK